MNDDMRNEIVKIFLEQGEDKLYKNLLVQSVKRIIVFMENTDTNRVTPDKELIHLADKFVILYRTEGEEVYLQVSKVIRRAAHKIYRLLLKKHLIKKDEKFLNLV